MRGKMKCDYCSKEVDTGDFFGVVVPLDGAVCDSEECKRKMETETEKNKRKCPNCGSNIFPSDMWVCEWCMKWRCKNCSPKKAVFSFDGKTGYIDGVKSFSGVCEGKGGDYVFSILANNTNGRTRRVINDIAKAIID